MVRPAAARLLRSPGHSLLAIGILAIGLGASMAIAAILHDILLRPLPFRDPARLIQISETNPAAGVAYADTSSLTAADWLMRSQSFETITAADVSGRGASVVGDNDSLWVRSAYVTWPFFQTLGVAPIRGRTFTSTSTAFDNAVVISHRLWVTRFGKRDDILDVKIRIDGPSWSIAGVMPEGFGFPGQTDIWRLSQNLRPRGDGWRGTTSDPRSLRTFSVVARLKPGVTLSQAQAEMSSIGARISQDHPDTNGGWGVAVRPLDHAITANVRPLLAAVSLACVLLLMMTAVNALNLSLARGWLRESEVAIHAALGASPARLFTMFLTERAIIAAGGTLGGALVGSWLVGGLRASAAAVVPRVSEVNIRAPEVLLVIGLAVALAVVEALVLQRRFGRTQLASMRANAGHASARPVRLHGLVAAEVALTVVLLVVAAGALAIVRDFKTVDRRYRPDDLVVAQLVPELARLTGAQAGMSEVMKRQAAESTIRAVAALPGVSSAGIAISAPFQGETWSTELVAATGDTDPSRQVTSDFQIVTNSYLKTLDVKLLQGRAFDDRDNFTIAQLAELDTQIGSVILNAALARRLFGDSSPLGKEVKATGRRIVVGVVDNARLEATQTVASPAFYVPMGQHGGPYYQTLIARMAPGFSITASAVIQAVRSVQPQAAVFNVKHADDLINEAIPAERVSAQLMRVFGAIALLISAAGLGTLSWLVVRSSKRAIAIRLMLGAPAPHVVNVVTRPAAWAVVLGVATGVAASLAVGRLLISRGYWRTMPDVVVVVMAVSLVLIAAAVAVALPIRRALQIDPLVTLKEI